MPSSRRNKTSGRNDVDITRLTRLTPRRSTRAWGGETEAPRVVAAASSETAAASSQTRTAPLCRFFVLSGNCRYGDGCAYSHALPEGGVVEARKQIPCKFYALGTCKYGDYCQLRHDPRDLPTNLTDGEKTSTTCGICLEDVTKVGHKFGLLSCCPHVFCFECLMEWRKEGSREAEDRRSCPTCRKHSDYVVPSDKFALGEEKDVIVAEYRAKLAVIPCKNFDGMLGSCMFGRDCFYAHLDENGDDIKSQDESMEELQEERMARRRRRRSQYDDIEMFNSFLLMLDLYASRGLFDVWDTDSDDDDDYYVYRRNEDDYSSSDEN